MLVDVDERGSFQHAPSFRGGAASGGLGLEAHEEHYQQLLAEVMQDGVITTEERARLDEASLGMHLDPARVRELEQALRGAYERHHGVIVREEIADDATIPDAGPPTEVSRFGAVSSVVVGRVLGVGEVPPSRVPPPPASEPTLTSGSVRATDAEPARPSAVPSTGDERRVLLRHIAALERRIAELESELQVARDGQLAVEVDLSDFEPARSRPLADDDPEALHRRLRYDPRDATLLRALYAATAADADRQWCVARALVFVGAASQGEREHFERTRRESLVRPRRALEPADWRKAIVHPDEDALVGAILGVIAPPVLLGRASTLRRTGKLPPLDPARRLDPAAGTVQAARCFGWAAGALGLATPPLYAEVGSAALVRMVPDAPPAVILGGAALSGRAPAELAFLAGRHLAYHRRERFLRLLLPELVDLQDLFLAALLLGQPSLPLHADVRARVAPIANALGPLLEAPVRDELRSAFQRFADEAGGHANLGRWMLGADHTAARAGLLLADDLDVATRMLALEGAPHPRELVDDLVVYATSARYVELRRELGIASDG
jgi:hypothetical protein